MEENFNRSLCEYLISKLGEPHKEVIQEISKALQVDLSECSKFDLFEMYTKQMPATPTSIEVQIKNPELEKKNSKITLIY